MRRLRLICLLVLVLLTGTVCHAQPALKDVFKDAFLIGSALNPGQTSGRDARGVPIVLKHFNTITPENGMKWQLIHPEPDRYTFERADQFVAFGEQHGMFIVGHTLVWHSQTPRWVFEDDRGGPATREVLLERMRDHIHTVVGRYRGRVHGWDVVNEALNEDGSLRRSPWLEIIGEDYLEKAFQYAHEADPAAQLYYNDYSLENPGKRAGAIRLVRNLQLRGIPVAGIGTQGHFSLTWPSLEELEATITAFAALGVDVMVTELDVDVLPDSLDPYREGLPDTMEQALAERYADLFSIFFKHREVITRITFWGVTDGDSWKNNWPVRGRTNYPLLFDRRGEPRRAFYAVAEIGTR